jgi:signal transduction histidine kinase
MPGDIAEVRTLSLATVPATVAERRLALAVVLVSIAAFLALAPLARRPLAAVFAFLPIYQSALVVLDVITAVLLFGQFRILRARALLALAAGYLFSAVMACAHALSFPGLFSPSGLLGAGPQTTAWLYFLWHLGFPAALAAYALARDRETPVGRAAEGGAAGAVLAAALCAVGAAVALTLLATIGRGALPSLMQGDGDLPAKYGIAWLTCLGTLAVLPLLARRRPLSVLDLWLLVVACAWLFDVALAAVFNAGRYSVGWYAGRVYGLLASSFVLVTLLVESARLYARTHRMLARSAERLRLLRTLERAVAEEQPPEALAAAVIQPLRELLDVPRAIVNQFHLEQGEVEWIAAAGRRRTHVGPGVRYSLHLMGDLAGLQRGEPQRIDVLALPDGPEKRALLGSDVRVYIAVPMRAGGELYGALSFGAPSDRFTPEQMRVAEEVATQLAIAMLQARLLAQVRSHASELEQTVRQRTEALVAANKELESFTYSVSHDLRAPLRAVDGYARMLQEDYAERLDDEGRRLLSVVRESAGRMGRLIDDLLAFSRLGRREPVKHAVDMAALAREVAEELRAGGSARIEIDGLPAAQADRALMRQVWANLIGNALKYSGKRADPRVEVGGAANGTENIYWVRDNGVGFDMRYVGKLFGVFQRLHGNDEFEGTGVGLAIVQRVVARHGGRVWAESKPAGGACFQFSLPRAE